MTYTLIEYSGESRKSRQLNQFTDILQAWREAFELNANARLICPEYSYSVKRS